MNQTLSLILWLIGLVFISMPIALVFRNRIPKIWFGRIFTILFFGLVALIVFANMLVAASRVPNFLSHPDYLAGIAAALICLHLLSMLLLLIWIYWTSKDWDFAFKVINKLEWPVKDKHLMSELSKPQIVFWKVAAFLRLVTIVIVLAVIAVKIILLFRF